MVKDLLWGSIAGRAPSLLRPRYGRDSDVSSQAEVNYHGASSQSPDDIARLEIAVYQSRTSAPKGLDRVYPICGKAEDLLHGQPSTRDASGERLAIDPIGDKIRILHSAKLDLAIFEQADD
jgi:hypothetical protein